MSNLYGNFSVAVIVVGEEGIPVVLEPRRKIGSQRVRWWKFPGGHGDPGETPKESAVREVFEETNIEISEKELQFLLVEDRQDPVPHQFYLFCVNTPRIRLIDRCVGFRLGEGITGEKTKTIKPEDIPNEIELQSHLRLLETHEVQEFLKNIVN